MEGTGDGARVRRKSSFRQIQAVEGSGYLKYRAVKYSESLRVTLATLNVLSGAKEITYIIAAASHGT